MKRSSLILALALLMLCACAVSGFAVDPSVEIYATGFNIAGNTQGTLPVGTADGETSFTVNGMLSGSGSYTVGAAVFNADGKLLAWNMGTEAVTAPGSFAVNVSFIGLADSLKIIAYDAGNAPAC